MLIIPSSVWEGMQSEFQKRRSRVEQVCFLEGYEFRGQKVVTTFTFPRAELRRDFFHIDSEQISRAALHLRAFNLRRLAQVHTHPRDWVGHSEYDNDHAYSQSEGALSIVLPNYGLRTVNLDKAGVLVRTLSEWLEINPEDKANFVVIVPSKVDLR